MVLPSSLQQTKEGQQAMHAGWQAGWEAQGFGNLYSGCSLPRNSQAHHEGGLYVTIVLQPMSDGELVLKRLYHVGRNF
jgi:hypothetical protein